MIPPHPRPLDRLVPRPTTRRPVTLELGRWQLLLECRSGAIHAVWHDGETVSRRILGVPSDGRLELRTRPPDHPLAVGMATPLSLLRGGRIRGFLRLPVQFQLVFLGADGAVHVQTFQERGLRLAWNDGPAGGEYTHPWVSELHGAPGGSAGDHESIWAPVRILHRGFGLVTVRSLRLEVRAGELREERGRLTAAPRRYVFGLDGRCTETVRGERPGEAVPDLEGDAVGADGGATVRRAVLGCALWALAAACTVPPSADDLAARRELEELRAEKLRREAEEREQRIVAALEERVVARLEEQRRAAEKRDGEAATALRGQLEGLAGRVASVEGHLPELAARIEELAAGLKERAQAAAATRAEDERVRNALFAELRAETVRVAEGQAGLAARQQALAAAAAEAQVTARETAARISKELAERAAEVARMVRAVSERLETMTLPAERIRPPAPQLPAPEPEPAKPVVESRPQRRVTDAAPPPASEAAPAARELHSGDLAGEPARDPQPGERPPPASERPASARADAAPSRDRPAPALPPASAPASDPPAIATQTWTDPLVLIPALALAGVCLLALFRGRGRGPAAGPAPAVHVAAPVAEAPPRGPVLGAVTPRTAAKPPRCVTLRIAVPSGDDGTRFAERAGGLLRSDERVLVRPEPRVEQRAEGVCSVRFYVHGALAREDEEQIVRAVEDALVVG